MTEDIKILSMIVNTLNGEIQDMTEGGTARYRPVVLRTEGDAQWITFFEVPIWNSEDDERDYVGTDGDLEAIEPFLRKQIGEIVATIHQITIK